MSGGDSIEANGKLFRFSNPLYADRARRICNDSRLAEAEKAERLRQIALEDAEWLARASA